MYTLIPNTDIEKIKEALESYRDICKLKRINTNTVDVALAALSSGKELKIPNLPKLGEITEPLQKKHAEGYIAGVKYFIKHNNLTIK